MFMRFLDFVGKMFDKGLAFVVKAAVPVETLVALIFPAAAPAATGFFDTVSLIQNAVLQTEQKFAAANMQSGTGSQKSAEVLLIVEQAVTGLLQKEGVKTDTDGVQKIIDAVVGILNAQQITVAGAAAVPAPAAGAK